MDAAVTLSHSRGITFPTLLLSQWFFARCDTRDMHQSDAENKYVIKKNLAKGYQTKWDENIVAIQFRFHISEILAMAIKRKLLSVWKLYSAAIQTLFERFYQSHLLLCRKKDVVTRSLHQGRGRRGRGERHIFFFLLLPWSFKLISKLGWPSGVFSQNFRCCFFIWPIGAYSSYFANRNWVETGLSYFVDCHQKKSRSVWHSFIGFGGKMNWRKEGK